MGVVIILVIILIALVLLVRIAILIIIYILFACIFLSLFLISIKFFFTFHYYANAAIVWGFDDIFGLFIYIYIYNVVKFLKKIFLDIFQIVPDSCFYLSIFRLEKL